MGSTLRTGGWRVEHDSRCIRKEGRETEFVAVPISSLKSTLRIVLLRNPWGNQNKWTGTWSDADDETWHQHPDVAAAPGFQPKPESGLFWMSFEDFDAYFNRVSISPGNMLEFDPPPPECNTPWGARSFQGYPVKWQSTHESLDDVCAKCKWTRHSASRLADNMGCAAIAVRTQSTWQDGLKN